MMAVGTLCFGDSPFFLVVLLASPERCSRVKEKKNTPIEE
jgi:hypothetical protein